MQTNGPPDNVALFTPESGCPPAADLVAHVASLLDAPAARRIADHVRTCQECAAHHRSLVGWSHELSGDGAHPPAPKQLFDRLLGVLHQVPQAGLSQSATAPSAPPRELRDYRLLEKLGEGGMGTVYRAVHTRLDRVVALKLLSVERTASPRSLARFEREMKAVGRLDHTHIVRAYDAGEAGGVHYLAMEFVEGVDLERLVLQQGPLTISDACEIIRQAALGLSHVHQHGLVHRDIKPSNLMLARNAVVKLLDLGLARLNEWAEADAVAAEDLSQHPKGSDSERLTRAGHLLGTIEFMAPEQAAHSHAVDIRADIYGLGATLFWLLTGEVPYPGTVGTTPAERLVTLQTGQARRLRELRQEAPPELENIVAKMLALDPKDRFAAPDEVALALAPLTADQAIIALVGGVASLPAPPVEAMSTGKAWASKPRRAAQIAMGAGAIGVLVIVLTVAGLIRSLGTGPELSPGKQTAATSPPVPPRATKDATSETTRTTPTGTDSSKMLAAHEAPPAVWSPLPLAEWLTNRRARTVSQDGSGEFLTLQSALDAVEAGQVIQVLDQGPYRERPHRDSSLPPDVGLISLVGTRIEIPEWHTAVARGEVTPPQVGMAIRASAGFRMSGIEFTAPPVEQADLTKEPSHLLNWSVGGDVVIENCQFLSNPPLIIAPPWTKGGEQDRNIDLRFEDAGLRRLLLRENLIEAQVSPRGAFSGELIVERNRILGRNGIETPEVIPRMVIRHNVIHASNSIVWRTWEGPQPRPAGSTGHLIANNLLDSAHPAIWVRLYSKGPLVAEQLDSPVTIQGNILRSHWGGGMVMKPEEWEHVKKTWKVSHNCYLDRPRNLGNGLVAVPLDSKDLVDSTPFLSVDESDPNYYRIDENGALARAGPGGFWPAYIGALPPGIGPGKGDWFSRFRRRQSLLVPTMRQPLVVHPSPPALNEWLPGRKVLTVAQNGTGDYRTLGEALDAVKQGEVVKVLDAGPYRESLIKQLPADTALISNAGSVVEVSRWIASPQANGHLGASLNCGGDFRLEGIQFEFGDRPPQAVAPEGLVIRAGGTVVVQHCAFRSRKPPGSTILDPLRALVVAGGDFPSDVRVERCLFEGTLVCRDLEGPLIIRENLVLGALNGIDLQPRGGDVVLRHNFVVQSGQGLTYRYAKHSTNPARSKIRLEVQNNTIVASACPLMVITQTGTTPNPSPNTRILLLALAALLEGPQEATIVNNVFKAGSYFGIQFDLAEIRAQARRTWQVGHNAYREEPVTDAGQLFGLGRLPADVIADPLILSVNPAESQFGQIAPGSPLASGGVGGAYPAYIGALPGGAPTGTAWIRELLDLRSPSR